MRYTLSLECVFWYCFVFFLLRYKAFRDDNGNYTLVYWELLAVRLGFIIAFEVNIHKSLQMLQIRLEYYFNSLPRRYIYIYMCTHARTQF